MFTLSSILNVTGYITTVTSVITKGVFCSVQSALEGHKFVLNCYIIVIFTIMCHLAVYLNIYCAEISTFSQSFVI